MNIKQTYYIFTIFISVLLFLCTAKARAQTIESTWISGNGNYSDLSSWDPILGAPPNNKDPIKFNVTIPEGGNEIISLDIDATVTDFTLHPLRMFRVTDGNIFQVEGHAKIYGKVHGNGGHFFAPDASFPDNVAQIWVDSGSTVEIGAQTYSPTGLIGNYTLLSSDGVGSVLDLNGMTELDDSFNNGHSTIVAKHEIKAINGGFIDLSDLTNIIGPAGNEQLDIILNAGGSINLDKLESISRPLAGGTGLVRFKADGNITSSLPLLSSVSSTLFEITNGGSMEANSSEFIYSATALAGNYTLLSSDGAGSVLDLNGMTELNDSFNNGFSTIAATHKIMATNGGFIDLSGLTNIIGPSGNESLQIQMENGTIDLSSLQTIIGGTGYIGFNLDKGGTLFIGAVSATKSVCIALNDPNDLLIGNSDVNLGTMLMVTNPGKGMLALSGDFSYAQTDETAVPFDQSFIFLNGNGRQELEVGGYDVFEFTEFLRRDDNGKIVNFGFGQMVVGHDDPNADPAVVLLVDNVDNGNRNGFGGEAEALYLFGKDGECGLRLLNGSILYMGGLHVYCVLSGVMTDLTSLFAEREVMIPFDEGWLCPGWPPEDGFNVEITDIDTSNCPEIQASVIVTDEEGVAIVGLDESNLFVYEDNGKQIEDIETDEITSSSISASLVLDYSGSMTPEAIEAMENAAIGFVSEMEIGDSFEIIKFADEPNVVQEYTELIKKIDVNDEDDPIIKAIRNTIDFDRNFTFLYDAIYRGVSDTAEQSGNKAVIAMTDGRVSKKGKSKDDVITLAVDEGIPVFTIGLGDPNNLNEEVLKEIATKTGGIYYYAPDPNDLSDIYLKIKGALDNMYVVTYTTTICGPDSSGDIMHELNIEVSRDMAYGQDTREFYCPYICDTNMIKGDNGDPLE